MNTRYKIGVIDPQFSATLDIEAQIVAGVATLSSFDLESLASRDDELASLDAVIHCRSRNKLTAEFLGKLKNTRIIVQAGVGTDHIDIASCNARNLPVCNVPDYGTREIADHALALMLNLRRGVNGYNDNIRERADGWSPYSLPQAPIARIAGQTLGIVGLGSIGIAVAKRAQAFDLTVNVYDPYMAPGLELALGIGKCRSLDELLTTSDIISLHCPLTTQTRKLINLDSVSSLKPGAVVINTARGEVVDLDALYEGLKSGRIGAVGLDVLPVEPPDRSHPLITAWIEGASWLRGRLLITPHAAFYSPQSVNDLRKLAACTALDYLRDGTLRACVNRNGLS